MKTVNPLLTRLVAKASKPRNHVQLALKERRGGAGAHRKSRGALRRAEHMAVAQALSKDSDAD
ncbi:MAG: hypothetical protein JNN20_16425 [Betaproteobacteria bacterium]|nr:hypothetical protein [Betaproteobacteria bacterium]